MKKSLVLVSVVLLVVGIIKGQANAIPVTHTAYQVSSGTVGNQSWPYSLGMDFDLNQSIEITALGVFDSGGDGLSGRLTVQVYDRTSTAAPLSFLEFTGTLGTLDGGSRFLALATPLVLSAGFQGSIVAFGFSSLDQNYNQGFAPNPGLTTDDGGGAISFVGTSRYAFDTNFPTTIDTGPANRYAAGTFQYNIDSEPNNVVPEPATLLLLGSGLLGLAVLGRKLKK